jgi:hypothetical protein
MPLSIMFKNKLIFVEKYDIDKLLSNVFIVT